MIRENEDKICDALFADLRKPRQEALISEVAVTLHEIELAKSKLSSWIKSKPARTPLTLWPARSRIHWEPLGVTLIIGPWNYPFQLLMAPLVGSVAAGNCAVIKPSELAPQTSKLVANLIANYFSPQHISVIEGGVQETTALLDTQFDHIFFTGSTAVGRIVMQAAAKQLTPVTLELGGKSPVIVCEDADLDMAAQRIVWGKFYNAGQTCIAPDYLCVHESVANSLLKLIELKIREQFGHDAKESQSYSRIINERNFRRLVKLLDTDKKVLGGRADINDLYIEPSVLWDVTWSDLVMQEEIFGPILPVMSYNNLDDLINLINSKPKPLAAYLFSRSKKFHRNFVENLVFGGGCVNDVLIHLTNPFLPFGGIGDSGVGKYHGYHSFCTFSHSKSVVYRYGFFDLSARYAPYTESKLRFVRRIFRV